jgi:hypothetical protein
MTPKELQQKSIEASKNNAQKYYQDIKKQMDYRASCGFTNFPFQFVKLVSFNVVISQQDQDDIIKKIKDEGFKIEGYKGGVHDYVLISW